MRKRYRELRTKFTTNTYMREALEYDIVLIKENNLFITIKKYKDMSDKFSLTNSDGITKDYIDKNYYVVELTPLDEFYNIRYYYNQNKEFIDYYIDISLENGIKYKIPYYIDLYLDVLHDPKENKVFFYDEDELQDALDKKIISKKDFNLAYKVGNKLLKELNDNTNKYMKIDALKYVNKFFK